MANSELIKNFDNIRKYMSDFYVYGFKSRLDYDTKSSRTYDYEKQRITSWLSDYIVENYNGDTKNVSVSVDTRKAVHNPLYNVFKSKSFTDNMITLHFVIMDILDENGKYFTLKDIMSAIDDEYFVRVLDESSVRKKLNEYINLGIIETYKEGKTSYYARKTSLEYSNRDVLNFFSEIAPCGVNGSYLLDKLEPSDEEALTFKHHYLNQALDSVVLYELLKAITAKEKMAISFSENKHTVILPLKIYVSSQTGRQWVLCHDYGLKKINTIRLSRIISIENLNEKCSEFDDYLFEYSQIMESVWGVSIYGKMETAEHVDFTITWKNGENFVYERLKREKRNGRVVKLSDNTAKFSCDVYDCNELFPWIRTFISRIAEINFSDKELEQRFKDDLSAMYKMYDLEVPSDIQ